MIRTKRVRFSDKKVVPWLVMAVVLVVAVLQLHLQGRVGWCACGDPHVWAGDIWSSHNSQHLFDPYSVTHILHGVLFCGIVTVLVPTLFFPWRLCIAVGLEALWEVMENSKVMILRYREATIGLGYEGDSILNSLGDILCCVIGFILARYLGFRLSLVLFVAMELTLLFWIRDNLILNVLMLLYPMDVIKSWQLVH